MDDSENLLDQFLALASENGEMAPRDGSFDAALKALDKPTEKCSTNSKTEPSLVHTEDSDSEDEIRAESRSDAWTRDIRRLLEAEKTEPKRELPVAKLSSWKDCPKKLSVQKNVPKSEYVFGLSIVNPLISTSLLEDRMQGRELVPFGRLKSFVRTGQLDKTDWVIAGAIVYKTPSKTSQNGKPFCTFTLSDLRGAEMKTAKLFLFGNAHKELWKSEIGTVLGVLNPQPMDSRDDKDEVCLSLYNPQKVMILGRSKDLSTCRSVRKSGDKCTNFVNLSICEYCVYHVRQEYSKAASRRGEIQSGFSGLGNLDALKQKVMSKTEFIYAGKMYTAFPKSAPQKKTSPKDLKRIQALNVAREKAAIQRAKDTERLRLLGTSDKVSPTGKGDFQASDSSGNVSLVDSRTRALDVIAKLKNRTENGNSKEVTASLPFLAKPSASENVNPTVPRRLIDLDSPAVVAMKKRDILARQRAVNILQTKGPLAKQDPNKTVPSPSTTKKRSLADALTNADKKFKMASEVQANNKIQGNEFFSDRFKKMMAVTSRHANLVESRDNEERDKYFNRLEAKERMEEKMATTFKIACKAVRCVQCKYTSFSAAESCKKEKHTLRVYDALKRFFACGNCGNRTACLTVVPVDACANCGSKRWERASMMKEKVVSAGPRLSIKGGDQIGQDADVSDSNNLDLLVPE